MGVNQRVPMLFVWRGGARSTKYRLRSAADRARDRCDWDEAVRLYEAHLEKFPDDVAAMVQLGHALKENRSFNKAGEMYAKALRATPLDDDLYLQIGHLEKLRGDSGAALRNYRKSYELNRANEDALKEALALLGAVEGVGEVGSESTSEPLLACGPLPQALIAPRSVVIAISTMSKRTSEDLLNERLRGAISRISK